MDGACWSVLSTPDAAMLVRAINSAKNCRVSVATYVETAMVAERHRSPLEFDQLIGRIDAILEPVTIVQAHAARQAFAVYGKGRHKAALNYGDCFAYALAKTLREPLLFKGRDFNHTDAIPAL